MNLDLNSHSPAVAARLRLGHGSFMPSGGLIAVLRATASHFSTAHAVSQAVPI